MDERAIAFGPFRLVPAERLLLEDERPVRLGSRAFDLLAALIERAGELIGKDELIARVWPNLPVDESNLKFQMSALRRALGDGRANNRFIATIPGRGYEFVAPISATERAPIAAPPGDTKAGTHNLPVAANRMIGRDEIVAALGTRLWRQRLVTIVGPGGIGKTTVALGVAETMITSYSDGVWLVDLAPLRDARVLPSTVATVLGLETGSKDPLAKLVASVRERRMLLVLDNCEHVIEAAAELAERMLTGTAGVHILATSREALRVQGEGLHRLAPLAMPQASPNLTVAEVLGFRPFNCSSSGRA
jgi:DNA-binding winged helix-turn-helix (wHTH) protein